MASDKLVIFGMGDRVINRNDYVEQMAPIVKYLRTADIRYCQYEGIIADKGEWNVGNPRHYRHPSSRGIPALKNEGMDIVSPNGNHVGEFGYDALLDGIDLLEKNGIKALGVGKDLASARKPVIMDKKGVKVGWLAYNSVGIKPGWAASPRNPGFVQIRVYTHYEPYEPFQPATPAEIISFPWRQDVAGMVEDIKKVRDQVDVLIMTYHCGYHWVRAILTQYETDVMHAAIDAGVDCIIGGHPHLLKGIEVYKGKPIFHSMGNWVFDPAMDYKTGLPMVLGGMPLHVDPKTKKLAMPPVPAEAVFIKVYHGKFMSSHPYNEVFGPDALNNGIARIEVDPKTKKISKVAFVPVLTNTKGQPIKCEPGTKEFTQVTNYMKNITHEAGLKTRFAIKGDEMVVLGLK